MPDPAPADLERFERIVALRDGRELVVREFTMRQRDTLFAMADEVGDDRVVQLVEAVLGPDTSKIADAATGDGEAESDTEEAETEIPVIDVVRVLASKVGSGVLSRFLAAALDVKDNRALWTPEGEEAPRPGPRDPFPSPGAYGFVLDEIHLSEETEIIQALAAVNDLVGYLGNWLKATPLRLKKKEETEEESEPEPEPSPTIQ